MARKLEANQVYRHYLGGLILVYGTAHFKALPRPSDCPIYSARSLPDEQTIQISLNGKGELFFHYPIRIEDLVIFHDGSQFYACPVSYFLEVLGSRTTHYQRYSFVAGSEEAQQIYGLVERYNDSTEAIE
jgi:hypothetical protein